MGGHVRDGGLELGDRGFHSVGLGLKLAAQFRRESAQLSIDVRQVGLNLVHCAFPDLDVAEGVHRGVQGGDGLAPGRRRAR
jgi:hypothetical protein